MTNPDDNSSRAAWRRTTARCAVVALALSLVFGAWVVVDHPGSTVEHWFRVNQLRDAWHDHLRALAAWATEAATQPTGMPFDPGAGTLPHSWQQVRASAQTIRQVQGLMDAEWVRFVHTRVMLVRKPADVQATLDTLADSPGTRPIDTDASMSSQPLPYPIDDLPETPTRDRIASIYRALSTELAGRGTDDQLKQHLREADRRLRLRWMAQRRRWSLAWWSMIGSLAVFAVSTVAWFSLRRIEPTPTQEQTLEDFGTIASRLRNATFSGAISLAALAVLAALFTPVWSNNTGHQSGPPDGTDAPDQPAVASWAERKNHWPMFRGRGGWGIAYAENLPTDWDGPSGRNILWKTEIPLPGKNSPVVWGDRIFLTGADKDQRVVYCFSLADGKQLWSAPVDAGGSLFDPPEVLEDTGYAAPTMATDGLRVFAIFANGDIAAFTLDGKKLWAFNLEVPSNMYGHSSSLAVVDNVLVVQFDQGGPDENKSAIFGFDAGTGNELYKTTRRVGATWASPIVVPRDQSTVVVTCTYPYTFGNDAKTGKQLWQVKNQTGDADVGPSAAYADGVVYVCNVRGNLAAIKLGGRGDVTETHVAWRNNDAALPNISSPVSNGTFIWTAEDYGTLSCFDATTGKRVWEQLIDASFHSSPIVAGNTVYLTSTDGSTYLFDVGKAWKQLARLELGEKVETTPAFIDSRIVVRGETHLYCIGRKP